MIETNLAGQPTINAIPYYWHQINLQKEEEQVRKVNVKVKQGFSLVFAASMLISFCVQPGIAQEIEALSDNKKKAVETNDAKTVEKGEYTAPPPEVESTSSTGKWLLYGGLAAAGVGIVAVAMSGGDSGGSGGSSADTTPDVAPVGPSLAGDDWGGRLTIRQEGSEGEESVTGVVTHSGESVTISTSSTLAYGQYYTGHTSASGYITVRDNATNKVWTTHYVNATSTSLQLYDFVNDTADYDTLVLIR